MAGFLPCALWLCFWVLSPVTLQEEPSRNRSFPYEKQSHWSSDGLSIRSSSSRWSLTSKCRWTKKESRPSSHSEVRSSWSSASLHRSARRSTELQKSKHRLFHRTCRFRRWFLAPWTSACQSRESSMTALLLSQASQSRSRRSWSYRHCQTGCSKASGPGGWFLGCGRTSYLLQPGTGRTKIQRRSEFYSSRPFQGSGSKTPAACTDGDHRRPWRCQKSSQCSGDAACTAARTP